MNEGTAAVYEVSTELTPYEAMDAAPHAIARVVGRAGFMIAFPVFCAILGLALVIVLTPMANAALFMLSPGFAILFLPFMTAIAAVAAVVGFQRGQAFAWNEHRRRFLAGLHRRGMPVGLKTRYAITAEALEMGHERTTYRVFWPAISEIVETEAAWVLQADLTSFCLPRRAFADAAAERAFIAALLEHVSDAALERSSGAVAFATAQ